ncbi:Jerky [Brachionus plicatilis]|uniref:Jerky n=1 Tax=Brachionus plicatilis TaxID=10195 RepID=A0A3M7PLM1_BRAPC|nr:Jerky [Brachionus plicatilis]
MNPTQAAKLYGITRQTLVNHLNGRNKSIKVDRSTVFNGSQEEALVELLEIVSDWGYCLDKDSLKEVVKHYAAECGVSSRFNDGSPGDDWKVELIIFTLIFRHRWNERLSFRTTNNLSSTRAASCTIKVLDHFYDLLERKLKALGLKNKPQNVFNVDETGFLCAPGKKKVFCKRAQSRVANVSFNNDKTMFTVQVCANAIGTYLPFYVLAHAVCGFEATGIFPLNRNALDRNKIKISEPYASDSEDECDLSTVNSEQHIDSTESQNSASSISQASVSAPAKRNKASTSQASVSATIELLILKQKKNERNLRGLTPSV